ncbi:MAG TPA: cation:proton antiporter, partial [Thermoleophilaceae bacterium]|nr:cation:proton antiporter [Thermoleophilaceae bacterium]
ASSPLRRAIARMHRTSAQISVRISFVLLAVLVFFAGRFGLEVVLGAFMAGAMVSLLDRDKAVAKTGLKEKLEGIGFGIFIPVFFVVSGVMLDLDALFASFETMVLVPLTVIALLLIRGVPVTLYRRFVSRREMVAAGLLQATSLSFIVPATQIGVELGKISTATAAGLVAGGVVTVLVFPALALRFMEEGRPA